MFFGHQNRLSKMKVYIGNCHPEKFIVDQREVGIDPDFIWMMVTQVTLSLKQYIVCYTER